jgi:hypothetical protein
MALNSKTGTAIPQQASGHSPYRRCVPQMLVDSGFWLPDN